MGGLASDHIEKKDLPFHSKGALPESRDSVVFLLWFHVDSLRSPSHFGEADIGRGGNGAWLSFLDARPSWVVLHVFVGFGEADPGAAV